MELQIGAFADLHGGRVDLQIGTCVRVQTRLRVNAPAHASVALRKCGHEL